MIGSKLVHDFSIRAIMCFGMLAACESVLASSITLNPPDSNSRIVVENAWVKDRQTTLLFWTYPYLGDPGSGKDCPLNFYTLTLEPGLPDSPAELLAKDVCGNGLSHGHLLENGDGLIMGSSQLARWRAGKKISSQPISALGDSTQSGFEPAYGGQLYDITLTGDITVAAPQNYNTRGGDAGNTWAITRLDETGKQQWNLNFKEPGQTTGIEGVWAANTGAAMVRVSTMPADNSSLNNQEYLYFIGSQGVMNEPVQLSIDDGPDLQTLMNMGQADSQEMFARLAESHPESIEKLAAVVRMDGGFDVLFQRKGGVSGREGHFLLKFNPNGGLVAEYALSEQIIPHGLENWTGFYTTSEQLILLSKVFATQKGVTAKRKKWQQNVVSWIDLDGSAPPLSRLIPLDERYLQAAMNAGDAQMQNLDGQPGGEPALLTTLADAPLAVSIGITNRKPALRLDVADDQLLAWTEAYDEGQARLAKENARAQRKADKQARKQQMNTDMAAAVGMTPEEYAALSNKEQEELMIRQGDFDAMNAAVMKQTSMAQDQAAITQGMPPEMVAQIQAAMAQAQLAMGAGAMGQSTEGPETAPAVAATGSFKMQVMEVFSKPDGAIVIGGKIESGSINTGDAVCLDSEKLGKRELKVEGIELFGAAVESARTGEVAGLQVIGISKGEAERGDVLRALCG